MKLNDDMQTTTVKGFAYSAVRPERLGASEYTLVTILTDSSGSTRSFAGDLLNAEKALIDACKKSPRSENLLIRMVHFNTSSNEVHGFKPLSTIDTGDYQVPDCHGSTALNKAVLSALVATNDYSKNLASNDYLVNAILVIPTDGDDTENPGLVKDVKIELDRLIKSESLESIVTILVGVNAKQYTAELEAWYKETGFTQFVDVGDATPARLARLADFVSRSISAQSQSLGTGGPSQTLRF